MRLRGAPPILLVTEFGRTVRGLLLLVVLLRFTGRAELRAGLVAHRNAQAGTAQAVARLRRHDVHFRAAHAFLLRFTCGGEQTTNATHKKGTVSFAVTLTDCEGVTKLTFVGLHVGAQVACKGEFLIAQLTRMGLVTCGDARKTAYV